MQKFFTLFWSLIICALLSACGNPDRPSLVIPSETQQPSLTLTYTPTPAKPTLTPTLKPTETFSPTSTPFLTYPPYPTKEFILDYYDIGYHTWFDMSGDFTFSNLVLYSDGQMILPGKIYRQKILSKNEMDQFLLQLEAKGFYAIDSNQHHDPTDSLYDFNGQYQRTFDGLRYCIVVTGNRERTLCAYQPDEEFLVPEMKAVLQFLDEYWPEGMFPYSPDRILLAVRVGNEYFQELPVNPWPVHLQSLETSEFKMIYAQGYTAKEIYALFDNTSTVKLFSQNGTVYTVGINIVLPHEEINLP
jgi:hypothetical protein